MIRDDREHRGPVYGYVIATDTFLSGWGEASSGKSFYAMAVQSENEAYTVMRNFKHRSDFKRVRFVKRLPRIRSGDHLSIADRGIAPRYFQPDAFARDSRRGRGRALSRRKTHRTTTRRSRRSRR